MMKLTRIQLQDRSKFILDYMGAENAASASSFDPNANIDTKNIATLYGEINKDIDLQVNRYILGERIKLLFGEETEREYYRQIEEHEIYSHDETAVLRPYCAAIDIFPFIHNGTIQVGGGSQAPKHLSSFCGAYVNLLFSLSAQIAGALADVKLLLYFNYFAKHDYGDNYLETHTDLIKGFLQQIIYTINQPAAARGYQAVFYNTSIFDENYFNALLADTIYPDGSKPAWNDLKKLQVFFMDWFNKEREKAILTFPVITAALQTENGMAKDIEFKQFLANQMSNGNSFFIYSSDSVDSLASCCRLRNTLSKNQFTYTLGGTGIATGSKKVFTININRMVQDSKDVKDEVRKIHKYLVAYNSLLYDVHKAKMLPMYDAGFISLEKQYLTIGVNGVVEAAEYLGHKISNNDKYKDWVKGLLQSIMEVNKDESVYYTNEFKKKIKFNTEFVPAENLGVKFSKWDKADGYKVSRDCYNSYLYIVEDDTVDFIDKFKLHGGEILQFLDGGSAYHLNLNETPTAETWLKIIDIATSSGCNYFTYNVRSTLCKDCGFISKQDLKHCVKCNSTSVEHLTRIIGYLKKIKSFSKERQTEANKRFYHDRVSDNA